MIKAKNHTISFAENTQWSLMHKFTSFDLILFLFNSSLLQLDTSSVSLWPHLLLFPSQVAMFTYVFNQFFLDLHDFTPISSILDGLFNLIILCSFASQSLIQSSIHETITELSSMTVTLLPNSCHSSLITQTLLIHWLEYYAAVFLSLFMCLISFLVNGRFLNSVELISFFPFFFCDLSNSLKTILLIRRTQYFGNKWVRHIFEYTLFQANKYRIPFFLPSLPALQLPFLFPHCANVLG